MLDTIDTTTLPDPYDPKPGDVYATQDEATVFARVYESARILVTVGDMKRPETVQEFLARLQGEQARPSEPRYGREPHRVPRRIVVYDIYLSSREPDEEKREVVRAYVDGADHLFTATRAGWAMWLSSIPDLEAIGRVRSVAKGD